MDEKYKIVVCASGGGGNFQALIDNREVIGYSINKLIVDRDCPAIQRATAHGIPVSHLARNKGATDFADNFRRAIPLDTDLIVLAGFMRILSSEFCSRWNRRIINTHPSLLPKHGGKGMYGVRVQESVIRDGDTHAGCTVHFVDETIDGGEIILQKAIPVVLGESPWDLGGRVFVEETKLLVETVRLLMSNALTTKASHS